MFGYPITPLTIERVENQDLPVQWFERDRLEDHGALGVMAGRLGAQLLELQGRAWVPAPQPNQPAGCHYFPETQHTLCEPFLSYWKRNGGLARFGYPITDSQEESLGNWLGPVQYFERSRMEQHMEFRGTNSEVLLGLLGQTIHDVAILDTACEHPLYSPWRLAYTRISFRSALGCPMPVLEGIPASLQFYEGGMMIWVDRGSHGRAIYVISWATAAGDAGHTLRTYQVFSDTWDASQPISGNLAPPAGRQEPQRGFGKVWREHHQVRSQLGWATDREYPGTADYQLWLQKIPTQEGAILWLPYQNDYRHGYANVYAFAPDERFEGVEGLR